MKSRIFQTFVCFILICCLIFACSPIQAEAVAISGSAVAVGVGIGLAVAVGLQALGIRQGTDGAAFSSLVSDCAAALSPEWAIDGLITMLALANDGVTKTYASRDFLQSILDWLFDSGSLTATDAYVFDSSYAKGLEKYNEIMSYPYHLVAKKGAEWSFIGSNAELIITPYTDGSGQYWIGCPSSSFHRYKIGPWGSPEYQRFSSDSSIGGFTEVYESGLVSAIGTSQDLTLESVGQDIDTDYETYVDESIISVDFGIQFEDDPNTGRNEEDNNKVGWVPTRLLTSTGDTYADQTQDDAQSGLTDPEILEGFNNNSGGGSDSGTSSDIFSSIKDFFTLSSDPAAWAIDLREFFPFCIPYDIYDFLSILAAEPEAPVFEWVIPVPQLGQTFELEVDLSAWDGVARLFRNLELLAFIVGLAYVTREKFIRG